MFLLGRGLIVLGIVQTKYASINILFRTSTVIPYDGV